MRGSLSQNGIGSGQHDPPIRLIASSIGHSKSEALSASAKCLRPMLEHTWREKAALCLTLGKTGRSAKMRPSSRSNPGEHGI